MAAANKSGKPIFANFTADWCQPCIKMKRDVYSRSDIADMIEKGYLPVKVDMTNPGTIEQRLAQRYDVMYLPTIMIIRPDGSTRARITGYQDPPQFLHWLDQNGTAVDQRVGSASASLDLEHKEPTR